MWVLLTWTGEIVEKGSDLAEAEVKDELAVVENDLDVDYQRILDGSEPTAASFDSNFVGEADVEEQPGDSEIEKESLGKMENVTVAADSDLILVAFVDSKEKQGLVVYELEQPSH